MRKMYRRLPFLGVLFISLRAWSAEPEVILVTANKQQENWLDTGMSLSVHDGDALTHLSIQQLAELAALTPGLDFQPSGQSGFDVPVMRGMSAIPTAFSSSTLLLSDGVPVTTAFGFTDAMLDLERVEVSRGPQSSLYGRNSDGGVIHLISKRPDFSQVAEVSATAGSRHLRTVAAVGNQPLTDHLAVRVAVQNRVQSGYVDNAVSGEPEDDRERSSATAALRWRVSDSGELDLRYRHLRFRDGGASWGAVSSVQAREERTTGASDSWNRSQGDQWTLSFCRPLRGNLTVETITGWRDYRDRVRQDTDYSPAPLFAVERDYRLQTLSQEVRLQGQTNSSNWVLGAYGDHSDNDLLFTRTLPQMTNRVDVDSESTSASVFGQWRMHLSDRWSLTAGGRVERERSRVSDDRSFRDAQSWSHWNPAIILQRTFVDEHNVYLRYSEGTRAGGFNLFALASGEPYYDPQTVNAWEFGLKGRGAALQYEFALYRMAIDDMQVQQLLGPGVVVITNAARGAAEGAELTLAIQLNDHWSLHHSLSFNSTEYREFVSAGEQLRGRRVPFTSPVQGALSLRYDDPEGVFAEVGVAGSRFQYLDERHQGKRPGYALLDMHLGYDFPRGDVRVFGKNLLDRDYHSVGLLNGTTIAYSEPRTMGVSVTGRFH